MDPLRRKSRSISLSRIGGKFSDGIAAINSTIEPRAEFWDSWNNESLTHEGPLWVALGDSVTQGIGSSNPESGYVSIVLNRLRKRSGMNWRVVNLSMSGGRFSDVTTYQLPTMRNADLRPDLVTAIIGSNDVMWRRHKGNISRDAREMLKVLPTGTFLSKVSRSRKKGRRALINSAFNESAHDEKIHLFNSWNWPTGEGMWAEDRFHPNDYAYRYIANNLWFALLDNDTFRTKWLTTKESER
tara:strand:- start:342 stop:1067 length:726 start_codon:yes stop_codon:yes gene_type:complete